MNVDNQPTHAAGQPRAHIPWLRWVGTIAALGLLIYLLSQQGWDEFAGAIQNIPLWALLAAFACLFGSRLTTIGRWLALLRAALEKLSNAPKEGAQTPEVGQSGEAASAESPAEAGVTLTNSPSGKHDPSPLLDAAASAAPSEKSPADALKPEKTLTSETPSSVRAEHADSTQTPFPTVRSDGFTPNPHLSSRADASAPTVLTVHTPPADTDRWASETTQRLVWVAGRGETKAELQLTPPSLGKLEVTLQLNHDQLTAHSSPPARPRATPSNTPCRNCANSSPNPVCRWARRA